MDPRKAEPYLPPNYLAPYYYPIYFLSQPADFVHPFYFYVQANPYVNVTLPASYLPQNNDHQTVNVSQQELPAEFGSKMRQNNDRNNLVNTDNTLNFLKTTEIKPNTSNHTVKKEEEYREQFERYEKGEGSKEKVLLEAVQDPNINKASSEEIPLAAPQQPSKPKISKSKPKSAKARRRIRKFGKRRLGKAPSYPQLEPILNKSLIFLIEHKQLRIMHRQIFDLAQKIYEDLQQKGIYRRQIKFKQSNGWLFRYLNRHKVVKKMVRSAKKYTIEKQLIFNSQIWEQFVDEELQKKKKEGKREVKMEED